MVNMLQIQWAALGVDLGFTCNCVVNIYYIFDAVSRNVIIPTNKVLTWAVYKIKTDSSG
jgi:hypothetical protein